MTRGSKIHTVCIEGPDLSGKTSLYRDLHKMSNFRWNIQDRAEVSMLAFSKFYERGDHQRWKDSLSDRLKDMNHRYVLMLPSVDLLTDRKATYVGYTASPFANFVVNPMNVNDIYPRNFIIPLPKPEGYFGGEELFGLHAEWSDDELYEDVLPEVFREVPPEEAELYKHTADNFVPQVGPELNNALLWFVINV